ncbi:MAG: hypothetical protein ACYC7J_16430 [Syntrophales bacterium]
MMKLKSAAVLAVAVGVFMTGATYRFHDSAHAIGRLSLQGGEVNHPVLLHEGKPLYTIIVTGRVAAPYRGDARVTIEGDLPMNYRTHTSEPVIDLGFFRRPQFRGNTLYDLREKDKVALWVVMRSNPQAGAAVRNSETAAADYRDLDCCDVQTGPPPGDGPGTESAQSRKRLSIAFRDLRSGKSILNVPIIFRGRGESSHGANR